MYLLDKDVISILNALITACSTLSAVFITNYFNKKFSQRNLRFELDVRDKEFKLRKLEEIYELFENWCTYFATLYLNYLRFHKGKISEVELLELINSTNLSEKVDFQRFNTLLNMYFPNLADEYEKVNKARIEVVQYMNTNKKNDANKFVQMQQNFEDLSKKFKKQISEFTKNCGNFE